MGAWIVPLLFLCAWFLPGVWVLIAQWRERRHGRLADTPKLERERAEQRSEQLLRDLLNEREYQQVMRHGYLEVASPNYERRIYRVPRTPGRIRVYVDGQAWSELCIQPMLRLPENDVILAHKLMIQGNEYSYLARANEFSLTAPARFYDQTQRQAI